MPPAEGVNVRLGFREWAAQTERMGLAELAPPGFEAAVDLLWQGQLNLLRRPTNDGFEPGELREFPSLKSDS